jgi:RsiW-degrading membrane proteinase PrsW (M82 family)
MTGESSQQAFLKQTSQVPPGAQPIHYSLSSDRPIVLGREPDCEICLDSKHYQGVSRKHAEILRVTNKTTQWQVRDLGSSNGTYINGKPLSQARLLKKGDRLQLGQNGPQFAFECQSESVGFNFNAPSQPAGDALRITQLLPILSSKKDLRWRKLMLPGAVTVFFMVLLLNYASDVVLFMRLLGVFLAITNYYVVYQLCGRHKPWWLLLSTVLFTILFNQTLFYPVSLIFRNVLPGNISELMQAAQNGQAVNSVDYFIRMLFGAGLLEELTKAIPVFALYLIGKQLNSPMRERVGVWEPLDGILLAAASAIGFTLDETLGEYVPRMMQEVGAFAGLQLLIIRIMSAIAGHVSYSGYFGYFIGLSVLKPNLRWQILAIGYLTSSIMHALWNSVSIFSSNLVIYTFLQSGAGILAYAFLIAAILKARQISPTRAENFATRFGASR